MSRARLFASSALAVAGVALLLVAGVALYVDREIADRDSFADRAVAALDDGAVREAAAEQIAQAMVEQGQGDLLAVRPLLLSAADALLQGSVVRRLVRAAARDAQPAVLEGEPVTIELADAGNQVLRALRSVSPRLAGAVPADLRPTLVAVDPEARGPRVAREADSLSGYSTVLWAGAAALLLLSLLVAPDRRSAVTTIAIAVAIGSALLVAALAATREFVVSEIASAAAPVRAEQALGGLWDAYLGDLRAWAMTTAAAALIVAGVASTAIAPATVVTPTRRLLDWLGQPVARAAQAARGAAVALIGGLLLIAPTAVVEAIALLIGGLLLALGAGEAVAALQSRAVRGKPPRVAARRRRIALAGALTAAIAIPGSALAVSLATGGGSPTTAALPAEGCNGSSALCGRRLNEVVFASTHNSFAAAREPGWLFANQRHSIERQLEDGIRGLFLDPHFGVRQEGGGEGELVRTDLRREQISRNRVARELGREALEAADRLIEEVGGGGLQGEPEVFLCHTLCELGAEPLVDELRVVGEFLERNPGEVVIVFFEPFVGASAIEDAFEAAGVLDLVAVLDRDRPLPTLGELVAEDERLVVLTERGGRGRPEWYMPGFEFVQDTPLGATRPAQLSCERSRGGARSPLLMLNHWVDSFPPLPSENAAFGGEVLGERVARCERERAMTANLLVVDFYEQSGVVELAARLNARPLAALER